MQNGEQIFSIKQIEFTLYFYIFILKYIKKRNVILQRHMNKTDIMVLSPFIRKETIVLIFKTGNINNIE